MLYKIISVQGDLAQKSTSLSYIHLEENGGKWAFESLFYKKIEIGFSSTINNILQMPITTFSDLSVEVSNKLAVEIKSFAQEHELEHKVDFIAFGGLKINDAVFLGNASGIALGTALPVIANFYELGAVLKEEIDLYTTADALLNITSKGNDENKNIGLALLAALRWREAYNISTNNSQNHIAGSIWLGVDA